MENIIDVEKRGIRKGQRERKEKEREHLQYPEDKS